MHFTYFEAISSVKTKKPGGGGMVYLPPRNNQTKN